ncbi:2-oxo acid dehydrogenase subunit E2, partial [Escherichia coli]|nr:2-oxo acid dehydrogenase subunit E2 [Escherichia coli]
RVVTRLVPSHSALHLVTRNAPAARPPMLPNALPAAKSSDTGFIAKCVAQRTPPAASQRGSPGGSTRPAAGAPAAVTLEGDFPETTEKIPAMRRAIAKAMVNSKHTAPHVTLMDEIDVQALWDHRKKFKEIAAEQGTKLTFLPYVVKALVSALKKYPALNTSFNEEAGEIVHKHYWNIGIAADTDRGLLVPVVK